MENKKMVYSTKQEHMSILMKEKLESEGINVLVMDHKDSAYTVLGSIELYVATEDEERAKAILAKSQNEE